MNVPDGCGLSRRKFLRAAALGAAVFGAGRVLGAAPQTVVVMTSYPDAVVARFEAAFAAAYPQYRLQILWRMPHDALPYLEKGESPVDVYWSASPRTFERLRQAGRLRRLELRDAGLPARIGGTRLRDADGQYAATEMAAYGFAVHAAELARLGVPPPRDWRDLADARLAGRIALPNPVSVGFAPVLIDIVLQQFGWEAGWALWNEIAGLSQLIERGATFIGDEVGSGRCAVGLSIDFFIASAIANGAPLQLIYPARSGINPGHVALLAQGRNAEGARAFAEFVLSPPAQRLLTHADIRKLPVRPAVYAGLDAGYWRPFEVAARGGLDYDSDAGRPRLGLVAALFGQYLAHRHAEQAAVWQQIHAGERAGRDMRAVRAAFTAPPLPAEEAADPALQQRFRDRVEGDRGGLDAVERRWQAATDRRLQRARDLLERAS